VLATRSGETRMHKPVAYQETAEGRREVAARYVKRGRNRVGFELGEYDRGLPLVIDPVLSYSTFFGGGAMDNPADIHVAADGSAYVAGVTRSADFPVTAGAYQTTITGSEFYDGFVLKLSPAGDRVVFATYLRAASINDLALDASGNVYVSGGTTSSNLPTTTGAYQRNHRNNGDGFVTKMNPDGSALIYSTYLGGLYTDGIGGLAVDAAGHAYVTGATTSTNFPVTAGAIQSSYGGHTEYVQNVVGDIFFTKLNPSGTGLVYSTYLGTARNEGATGLGLDSAGNVYIAGSTDSEFFPVTPGAFQTTFGGRDDQFDTDAFVLKLAPAGNAYAISYSTYLGGAQKDFGVAMQVDASGSVYLAGDTESANFPTVAGSYRTTPYDPFHDAYAAKLSPDGSALVYSTYIGGASGDHVSDLAIDGDGNAYVDGHTLGSFFAPTPGCESLPYKGLYDVFVFKLSPDGKTRPYFTYLGGSNQENANGIAVDAAGDIYLAGGTNSNDFPTTPGAYQTTKKSAEEAYVVKISPNSVCPQGDKTPPVISCPSNIVQEVEPGECDARVTYAAQATDDKPGVTVTYDPPSGSVFPVGTTTVTATATDAAGNTASCRFDVTVLDKTAPTISCPAGIEIAGNIQGSCAANVEVGAPSAADSCSAVSVTGARGDGLALDQPYPQGTTVITWTAVDAYGNAASCQQHVTVTNPAPSVTVTSPESGAVYPVGTSVNFAGTYTDNAGGTHAAAWTFGDATQAGAVDEAAGAVTGSYVFTEPGVYAVKLRVEDGCGGAGEATTVGEFDAMVVVYDPAEGFVTGGGWINSQPGAYPAAPGVSGKANFGLVSKYLPAGGVPTGETEFQLKAGDLNFHSTAYEWLVVSGARAQYRGTGRVNNAGSYGFIVTVLDGDMPGGDGIDRFRIKIWDKATGAVVYDNQPGAPNTANPTAPLGGGQIVIHQR
jgi:hypothetical protein